jgi:hypothetical protein
MPRSVETCSMGMQTCKEKCIATTRYKEICREQVEIGNKISLCTRKDECKFVRKNL